MTTLSRQPQKVFAGSANADQIAVFASMKTGTPVYSTSLATLQSSSYLQGWADAIKSDKAPYLEEMNAVQYGFSYQLAYILQEGTPEYDNTTEYSDTSLVKSTNNGEIVIYRSLSDGNTGNALSDTTYWKKIFSTGDVALSLTGEVLGTGTYSAGSDTLTLATTINQSNKIDGQWVFKQNLLSTATAYNNAIPYEYDLSTYLGVSANSTVQYEVLFAQNYYRESSSSTQHGIVYSDVISDYTTTINGVSVGSMFTSSYGRTTGYLGTIPVKTKLYLKLYNAMDSHALILAGYRRLGTNQ